MRSMQKKLYRQYVQEHPLIKEIILGTGYIQSIPTNPEHRKSVSWPTGLQHSLSLVYGELKESRHGGGIMEATEPSGLVFYGWSPEKGFIPERTWDLARGELVRLGRVDVWEPHGTIYRMVRI